MELELAFYPLWTMSTVSYTGIVPLISTFHRPSNPALKPHPKGLRHERLPANHEAQRCYHSRAHPAEETTLSRSVVQVNAPIARILSMRYKRVTA